MDRRFFLQALAVSLTSSAISAPAIASVEGRGGVPAAHPYQKYLDALVIFDSCVMWNEKNQLDVLNKSVDRLLAHFREKFQIPAAGDEEAMILTKDLLSDEGHTKYADFRSIPPVIGEKVWPILIMKVMLRDYRLRINLMKLKEFKWFHETYGSFILG